MKLDETEALEVELVLEAVRLKYGYDLSQYAPSSMQRRVLAAMLKCGAAHLGDLQHRLLSDRELFGSFLNTITAQVSEMFRDPSFYRAFRRHVVPLLRTYPQLKIWHAGCAAGEEVYATAILLREEKLYERTQIYATDMSSSILERAREGVYSREQAELFAKNYRESGGTGRFEDYYSEGYGRIAVSDALKKHVVFFHHDLATDYGLGEMHVIFCRNVLIYFGTNLRARVLTTFCQNLVRGGFLCLGSSESLFGAQAEPFADFVAPERIYRRV
jgi:chemotaxis protein methyltransferase CheR